MKVTQYVKALPIVGVMVKSIYSVLMPKKSYPTFWINRYLKNTPLSIVQIGSNDGVSGDPIFELIKKNSKWKVLFVEPVPYLFSKLKKNYSYDPRFVFENVAINDGTTQVFYSVQEDANKHIANLPPWYDQLGSFNRDNLTNHLDGILAPYIVASNVNGITLDGLFTKNKIIGLDLLHIDTEGYDFKILSQLDLNKYSPTIILFEHKHLNVAEKKDAVNFLKEKYDIFGLGGDFLCVKKNTLSQKDAGKLKRNRALE